MSSELEVLPTPTKFHRNIFALAQLIADHNEWPNRIQYGMISLDRNDWEVINLLSVLTGLYLKTEKILQFSEKRFSMCVVVPAQEVNTQKVDETSETYFSTVPSAVTFTAQMYKIRTCENRSHGEKEKFVDETSGDVSTILILTWKQTARMDPLRAIKPLSNGGARRC